MEDLKDAECPLCGAGVEIKDDLEAGDITYCPSCGAELEIVNLYPAELQEVEKLTGEDNEEEDDYNEM